MTWTLLWGSLASPAAADVLPVAVRTEKLDNGLTVHLAPMDTPGVVSWQSWVEVGHRNELDPGTTGFAHFFEHLMFYGTAELPREAREAQLQALGVSENAWTWNDDTVYHCVVATEALPEVVRIEADRFQHFQVTEAQLTRESGAVDGEYRMGRASPWSRTFEGLYAASFSVHTYHHPTIGWKADIDAMPTQAETAAAFFDTYYRPDRVRIVVAGDFDADALLQLIDQHYGGWARGPEVPVIPAEPVQEGPIRVQVPWDGGPVNPQLMMGWRVPGFDPADPTSAGLDLIGELLTSDVAPLKRALVDEQRWAWDVGGGSFQHADPHLFLVEAELTDAAHLQATEDAVLAELERLAAELGADELDAARNHALRAAQLKLDDPVQVAELIGHFTRGDRSPAVIETYFANYAALTVPQVRALVAQVFTPENSSVAILDASAQETP